MTDEGGIDQLVKMMVEITVAIRKLAGNQEALEREQAHCAKALGELGLVMRNHAEILRQSQTALEMLWEKVGLPFDRPEDAPPVN